MWQYVQFYLQNEKHDKLEEYLEEPKQILKTDQQALEDLIFSKTDDVDVILVHKLPGACSSGKEEIGIRPNWTKSTRH